MERRKFLADVLTEKDPPKAEPAEKFQNTKLPDVPLGVASVAQYGGPWGEAQVKHLLRRALFGYAKEDIAFFKGMTMSDAVDYLMNVPAMPPPPVNGYNKTGKIDPNIASGSTWVNGPEDGNFALERRSSLYAWTMEQIMQPQRHIREKMTVFMHNHFATEAEMIPSPIMSYRHHNLLRQNCLGNFKSLVRQVTSDSAMLFYLNGYVNTKTAPDENYARELMELFTLGKGADSQYTEADVKAAARVLTGWRINYSTLNGFFDPNQHDTGNKTFSAFYNTTTITGKTGANGALETDELINMIFTKDDVVARYIVRKLYRYFVYYVIDATIETNVIIPLANIFKQNWEIKPVVTALLKSEHFYDANNMGCYIKNPVDVLSTFIKNFKVPLPTTPVEKVHDAHYYLWLLANVSGMALGNPPNVSGWPAYYQMPQYYQLWLNSDSLPKRIQFNVAMMVFGLTYSRMDKLQADVIAFAKQTSDPSDPNVLIQECIDLLFAMDISQTQKTSLKQSTLLFGQTQDYYWTTVWSDHIANPTDPDKKTTVENLLKLMLKYLLDLAEHQLA